jgi:hypothetical protein
MATKQEVEQMFAHLDPPPTSVLVGGGKAFRDQFAIDESKVDALFKQYTPKIRPDSVLLNVAHAFYSDFHHAVNATRSFDQALPAMARCFATQYKEKLKSRTSNGDLIEIVFWFDNFKFIPPYEMSELTQSLPPTPMSAIRTGQTYACGMKADFNATLSLVETTDERQTKMKTAIIDYVNANKMTSTITKPVKKEVSTPKTIKIPGAFKTTIPIVVGSSLCRTRILAMQPLEAWLIGEDPYDIGGYVILDGQAKTVGGVYTQIPNFGMIIHTQYKTEEVRMDLMVRKDPFYGNTAHCIPSIVKPIKKSKDRKAYSLIIPDITIELPWTVPDMNAPETGSVRAHASRVPVKALFHYYGCTSDSQIQDYVFPDTPFSDGGVKVLADALTKGSYHQEYRDFAFPYSPDMALLFIAKRIISQNVKDNYARDVLKDIQAMSNELKLPPDQVADVVSFVVNQKLRERTKQILSEIFFFNINQDPRKVCQAIGNIVARMINIHLGIEEQTDRNAMYNQRVQTIGEQLIIEGKTILRREVNGSIKSRIEDTLLKKKSWPDILQSFEKEIKAQVEASGPLFGKKIKQAYKSANKAEGRQPRLLGEVYDPKSIAFLYSKINEDLIRPALGEKDATVVFERRRAHPAQFPFRDATQTPDSGGDVGRYNQPTVLSFLSMCQSERPIREVLGMADTNHPSPTAELALPLEKFVSSAFSPLHPDVSMSTVTTAPAQQQ